MKKIIGFKNYSRISENRYDPILVSGPLDGYDGIIEYSKKYSLGKDITVEEFEKDKPSDLGDIYKLKTYIGGNGPYVDYFILKNNGKFYHLD